MASKLKISSGTSQGRTFGTDYRTLGFVTSVDKFGE